MVNILMIPGMLLISLFGLLGIEAQVGTALEWYMGAFFAIIRFFNWGF